MVWGGTVRQDRECLEGSERKQPLRGVGGVGVACAVASGEPQERSMVGGRAWREFEIEIEIEIKAGQHKTLMARTALRSEEPSPGPGPVQGWLAGSLLQRATQKKAQSQSQSQSQS